MSSNPSLMEPNLLNNRPLVLIVLDGWGHSEDSAGNAILSAHKPVWDQLWHQRPRTLISTSGIDVGLPDDQMGNSEVGHLNLGAGRVVYQEFTRIGLGIRDGSFFNNSILTQAVDAVAKNGKALHIFGLLSPGGVHSHEEHIHAMAELAVRRGAQQVYLHAFLDGRDTPPRSAAASLEAMQHKFDSLGRGRIVSLIGRYYAMDRDNRWERVQQAYDLLTTGKAAYHAPDAATGLELAYARGESDEFVQATAVHAQGEAPVRMMDGDAVVFMNFRADRARQLTRTFIESDFADFPRELAPKLVSFSGLTEYNEAFHIPAAFPPESLDNVFGAYIAGLGLRQLRIAETEKYAHVTFFFNGGEEQPFNGEDRILIPSPRVATYDLQPEMSAPLVIDELVRAIESNTYDAIICNLANADMVGHTGNFAAAVSAIETLDVCVGRVVEALQKVGGELLITADHGNAEQMSCEKSGQAHTAHTVNRVPFVYVGRPASIANRDGALQDVAPTMLYLMGLDIPDEMSGATLIELAD